MTAPEATDAWPADTDQFVDGVCVYEGRRLTTKGKLWGLWRHIESDQSGMFDATSYQVGGHYRVACKFVLGEWTAARFAGAHYVVAGADSEREEYMARQRAAETDLEEQRAAKRLAADDALKPHLDALRAAYAGATWPQKAGVLAYMISRITGGR